MKNLKKAMVICRLEGVQTVSFYDDVEKAVHDADVVMNCLGGWAQVYKWENPTEENDYYGGYVLEYEG